MRQEIARLIHNVNAVCAMRNAHVHVQPENQVSARDQLHVLHDLLIAIVRRDVLIHPMRKRVCAGRGDFQAVACRKGGQFAAQFDNVLPRITVSLQISVPSSTID